MIKKIKNKVDGFSFNFSAWLVIIGSGTFMLLIVLIISFISIKGVEVADQFWLLMKWFSVVFGLNMLSVIVGVKSLVPIIRSWRCK